jgi:hypothetical protein
LFSCISSRPFAGRAKLRAGTPWLSGMPEPVMDGLEPPSNGGVQGAGLRRQVAGPVNSAVGSVADDVVDLERCPVCCAQPVDEDPPVGQRPDVVVETLADEEVIGVAGELGLDHAYVTVAVHAEEVDVTTAPRLGTAVAAGPPCGEFSQGWLLDADQARISPYHGLQPVLVRSVDRGDPVSRAAVASSARLLMAASSAGLSLSPLLTVTGTGASPGLL